MQNKVNQFIGISFVYEKKLHKVESVKIVNHKAVIKTDRQTFVKLESELDDFLEEIDFRELSKLEQKEPWLPAKEGVREMTVLEAEIIHTNSQSRRITDKLESVFNELAICPKEETFKKAKAMVDASNAIVNMQLANYKYLTLK